MKEIVVKNEDQAFKLLERALNEELGDQPFSLKFDNWPTLSIRLTGEGYDSAITADIAEAVVEVQRAVNRAYARTVKGTTNSRTLTDTERRDIQFKAKVKKGSSVIEINLGEFADKLATSIATKMTPEMLTITVVATVLTGAGYLAYKAFLNARSNDKQIDVEERTKLAMSQEETKRLEVFAAALTRVPELRHTAADFDDARNEILRSAATADTLTVNSLEINAETARVIGSARRAESEEVQLNGNYLILATDLRQPDEIRLRVQRAGDGKEFFASFKDNSLRQSQIRALQEAEWTRGTVYLSINGRSLRGEITTATVISVKSQPSAQT